MDTDLNYIDLSHSKNDLPKLFPKSSSQYAEEKEMDKLSVLPFESIEKEI